MPKDVILIVDDDPLNIDLLVEALAMDYRLGVAKDGEKALAYLREKKVDLVLLDVKMPGMDGFDVCRILKDDPKTRDIPVIFLTALEDTEQKSRAFALGAVDYITKPFNISEVKARLHTHLSMKKMQDLLSSQNIILEERVRKKTSELRKLLESIIQTMSLMVETVDPYTAGHQQRVSDLGWALGRKLGLDRQSLETVRIAGKLHDLGKIRVPISILTRPGKLLSSEFEVIKIHPQVGYNLLQGIHFDLPIAQTVYQHHERLDGSGYPLALMKDEIVIEARIVAVADTVEAMGSHRPYRRTPGLEAALAVLRQFRSTKFDSEVVRACLALFEEDKYSLEDGQRLF